MDDTRSDPGGFGVIAKQLAHCDMDTEGGGWLVIQRRINGSVDFYRNWTDYVYGFGDLDGEFWYGLEKIHCLTTRDDVELRIEIGNGTTPSIVWTPCARCRNQLAINHWPGNWSRGGGGANDGMTHHNGQPFSTRDRDNDAHSTNCATLNGGAWWYKNCYYSNLNGRYGSDGTLNWRGARTPYASSPYNVAMKIRPKICSVAGTTCN